MKIAFLTPSLHQGGLENAVTVLVNQLTKIGHDVFVICYYDNPIFYKLDKRIRIYLPPYKRKGYSTFHYYFKSYSFIKKILKEEGPDVIISYGDYINPVSILASRSLGLPIYVSDRSSPSIVFPLLVSVLRKFTYGIANGIIAQTERAKSQKLAMLGPKAKILVLPNPIRPIKFKQVEKEKIILCVARHFHVKGIDRLLEAFSLLKQNDWSIHIAGAYGPETENLIKLATYFGIAHRVNVLGPRKDIDDVYAYSSIFVLPSRSEGLPNALIEAMAHGLACISFDINAGPSDVIEHGVNGILVEDGNIDELASRIKELIENNEKRKALGNKAKEIKERLSLDRITTELLTFIKD